MSTEELVHPYCGGCGHLFFDMPRAKREEADEKARSLRCRYCIEEAFQDEKYPQGDAFDWW